MPARNERTYDDSDIRNPGIIVAETVEQPNKTRLIRRIVGHLVPFDPDGVAAEIVNLRREGAHIVIRIGRYLVQAQEHYRAEGFDGNNAGDGFRSFCERAGIGVRNAYNYIRIVSRLAESGLLDGGETPLLQTGAGVSKLLTIVELDPDDLNTLSEGGSVEGLGDLDEVERMTAAELRKALRNRDREIQRAVEQNRALANRAENAEAVTVELRRKLDDGLHAATDVELEAAKYNQQWIRWLHTVQRLPIAERRSAMQGVFNLLDNMQECTMRAFLFDDEKAGYRPLPNTDHLTDPIEAMASIVEGGA